MNFTKKQQKKTIFVHYQSAIQKTSIINFLRNERKRIEDKCSTKTTAKKHQNNFDGVRLRLNGYPESIIDQTKHSQNHQKDPRPLSTEWSYLTIPYISERLNYIITSIFRKEGIPVRVAHKSYTLRRALSHNNKERTCTRANCPISDTRLCLLRNAVYQIMCNNCNQHYIGSTTRFIHDRVREHLNNDNSSVKKHLSKCQGLQRHRNEEYRTRKRPREFTIARSVLHTKPQTYHQLPREMQRIPGPFILKIILFYFYPTLTPAHYIIPFASIHICT